ncbi:MAG: alpha/beta fold hydrolase [Piscinibacter sp.]|uniref:alpha/beta hydrolase n=1 Tax=Piscinibacter sp. TaxID=1903157 RepID=UPI00258876D8|nr:alpha/beta fold hydrolase [Piscinibacter sp.]MCW5663039.1 alpha/beta fold hydrolase [Piscinibacter sp.]
MPRLRSWFLTPTAAVLLAATLAGCSTLELKQREWIFQPNPVTDTRSGSAEGMQDVWIEHDSAVSGQRVKLHGLWLPQARADAPVLLYLHGARRNIWGSTFRIRNMHELGFSVLAIDYRGFGRSSDELPSEAAVVEDARAAWDWLARSEPQRPRYVFGHSLGGAIAVQLAGAVDDARGLIVEGTFTSIPDVFRSLKWGWLPITPLITQRFDSTEHIRRVRAPVLVVHGSEDRLIRPELGRALFEQAGVPKRFVLVQGGTHYSTNGVGQALYRDALRELFGLAGS